MSIYDPYYTGDRFDVVGFDIDDSVSDADFMRTEVTQYGSGFGSYSRSRDFLDRPTGIHGNRGYVEKPQFRSPFGNPNPFGINPTGGQQFQKRGFFNKAPEKSRVTRNEDGSYTGALTSRTNPETGKVEYGRHRYGGTPQGAYGLNEKGEFGTPQGLGYQPFSNKYQNRKSDTRAFRSNAKPDKLGFSIAIKGSGGTSRATSAGLSVGEEGAGRVAGLAIPLG